jgi:PAS domain S-box-containing protein
MAQLEFQFARNWNRSSRWTTAVKEYGLALGLALAGFGARWLIDPYARHELPYITFYLAVIFAVRFTGTGPALTAIIASFALAKWFFVDPRGTFLMEGPIVSLEGAFFVVISLALLGFAVSNRRSLNREREAIKALEEQKLELAASEELNRRVLASSKDCIEVLTLEGHLISMNSSGKRLLGVHNFLRLTRQSWVEFWPVESRAAVTEALKRARSGLAGEFESSRNHSIPALGDTKPTALWWDVIVTPISDQYGRPERLLAISRDVTERRQAEEARRISEERRALAMAAIGDSVWDVDIRHDRMTVNENFELNYGTPADQNWREWWLSRVHPGDRERVAQSFAAAMNGKGTHWAAEYRILCANGEWGFVLDRAQIAREKCGRARRIVGAMMDLLPLRQAERRTELLAETSNALLRSDSPQKVIEQLCGKVMEFLECDAFVNFLYDDESGSLKLNAAGGLLDADAQALGWDGLGAAICDCVAREGRPIIHANVQSSSDRQMQVLRAQGLQAFVCNPLFISGNKVIGTLSFGTRTRAQFDEDELALMKAVADQVAIAVERQRASLELRQANEELEQRVVERTKSLRETTDQLNSFCYSVAHDLRAPLRTQMGFAHLLLDDYGKVLDDTGKCYLKAITQAAERQSNIIHDLMAHVNVSRADLPLEPVVLSEALSQVRADLEVELQQKKAALDFSSLNDESVLANRSSMHLVLLNLVSNACKFVGEAVTPQVRIRAEQGNGERIRLWVEDNGIGIDPKDAGRLFGMFQRLQKGYPGTGMGLAIVKTAVERMGGAVGFESAPGQGSSFWIELPCARSHRDSQGNPSAAMRR